MQEIDYMNIIEMLRDALEPFAKAGELFSDRPKEIFDQLIYLPAAGENYKIVGDDLRKAYKVFKETMK